MNGTTTKIIAVAAVAVIVLAGVAFFVISPDEEEELKLDGSLAVYGNADKDYKIDKNDLDIVKKIVNGEEGYTLSAYPMADATYDNKVDQDDIDLINKILNKEKCRINVINDIGDKYVDWCNWPVEAAVATGTTPFVTLCKVSGIIDHIKGVSFWPAFGVDPLVYPELAKVGSVGKGANFFDFETVSQMQTEQGVDTILTQSRTPENRDQFNEIGIGCVVIQSNYVDILQSTSAMLLMGFLCDENNQALEISKWYQDVMELIDKKLEGVEKTTFMATMSKVKSINAANDKYTQMGMIAGGQYPDELKDTTTSTTLGDWMYNVDTDIIIGCLSSENENSWYSPDMKLDGYKELMSKFKDTKAYKDGNICVIAMNLPVPVKVIYHAHALHPDIFSEEWANDLHQEFIDKFYGGDFDVSKLNFFLDGNETRM